MKPIEFDAVNVTYANWMLSWRERIKISFTGKLWISMLTFNNPLQPIKPEVDEPW